MVYARKRASPERVLGWFMSEIGPPMRVFKGVLCPEEGLPEGYILPGMPPTMPPRVVYPRYIRLPPTHGPCTSQPAHHHVDNRPVDDAGLIGTSKRGASLPRKRASFSLQDKPSNPGETPHYGQETFHRESPRTRSSRMS